ncbi:hypothetical protein LUZ62_037233 [Rhynchospora pubera]|uniref:Protein SCAI n=1 Tax=Rhynchospora pubera TaxID=906938 RepID=A0AAV8F6Z5_9POAL|nr:hypothetical protein LUZ62_037233 [Rhynchospora pubera]
MAQSSSATTMIPVTEQFWSLVDKADRRFSLVRDLPIFGRNRNDLEFHKAFKIYTRLWRMQQENRQRLVEAGMKRWEVGEIASRIAQLYYGQYQRTSDGACLSEAYVFYEAILDRDYFRDTASNSSASAGGQDMVLANKQLRFLARFLTVCLVIGNREMVTRLTSQLKTLLDDCRKTFQEAEYKEWKHVMQEISKFLKADTSFMNKRPLRYNYAFDTPPDSLPPVGPAAAAVTTRNLLLRDSLLCSHYPHEVKFTELTLDTFRMLQCLEWDPCGSFAQQIGSRSNQTDTGPQKTNLLQDLKDPSLPPNPLKTILYRPSATHYLTVLATKCEELPADGILLIYLSAAGDSRVTSENYEKIAGSFRNLGISSSSDKDPSKKEGRLWLGYRANEGSSYVYPCDLIPFTRRPLFLIIDSCNAHAFKSINGEEKGETVAMLLSPISRSPVPPTPGSNVDPTRQQNNGSQFTMFLTAPLQAFCILIGKSSYDFDTDKYVEAEKLFHLSLNDLEAALITSAGLHAVWVEALGDPFLRRFLLRFIFCRAVLALFKPNSQNDGFTPTCLPSLPESVNPGMQICQAAIRRMALFFGAVDQFDLSEMSVQPEQSGDELSTI